MPIPSCFLFSVKTLSEIRSRDVLFAAVTCHLGQMIAMATRPKSARNGRSLKHKSTHKNSLCDFSSHMAMSETPVPQVIYPKLNPSYLHHISITSPSSLPYFAGALVRMASVPASGRKNKSPSTAVTARREAIWHSCAGE